MIEVSYAYKTCLRFVAFRNTMEADIAKFSEKFWAHKMEPIFFPLNPIPHHSF
jgi:hypothetical protein